MGVLLLPVTPDSFRGPPGGKGTVSHQADLLAAEWTPEHVRGDGVGWEGGGLKRASMCDSPALAGRGISSEAWMSIPPMTGIRRPAPFSERKRGQRLTNRCWTAE